MYENQSNKAHEYIKFILDDLNYCLQVSKYALKNTVCSHLDIPHPPRKLAWDNFPLDNSQPKNFQISGKGSYLRGTCSCHGWKLYGGKCRSWELCKCTLSQCLSRGKPSRWGMQGRKGCPSMATATQGLTTF